VDYLALCGLDAAQRGAGRPRPFPLGPLWDVVDGLLGKRRSVPDGSLCARPAMGTSVEPRRVIV
jgi:hypothetical protein